MRVPFVIYADFESRIVPIDTCQPNPNLSYANNCQKHKPIPFSLQVQCFDDTDTWLQVLMPYLKNLSEDPSKNLGRRYAGRKFEIYVGKEFLHTNTSPQSIDKMKINYLQCLLSIQI